MRFQAPFGNPGGPNDTTAVYINGNPDTGTKGSCPPAASIEYPQREIVNFIADAAALVPADTDLHQLGKSVQSNTVNFGVDIGTVNAVLVVLSPVPDAYYSGMQLRFRAKFAPSGAATLDAGRGAKPIVKSGGGILAGGEWSVGDIVQVAYDAVLNHWQLPVSPYAMLYSPRTYYVNGTTGSDSNDGLSSGTAFATLQRAQNQTALYNLNGFNITINVANGTYTGGVSCGVINGAGSINYVGNTATPSACVISNSAGSAFAVVGGKGYGLTGFRLTSTGRGGPGVTSNGVLCQIGGSVTINLVDFYNVIDYQVAADAGSFINYTGPVTISGGGSAHIFSANNSFVRMIDTGVSINVPAPVSFSSAFIIAWLGAVTWIKPSPLTGGGNVTGQRYNASTNGVIQTDGGGVNFYPGTIAGSTSSGGQYV